jgi:hypothetical protein
MADFEHRIKRTVGPGAGQADVAQRSSSGHVVVGPANDERERQADAMATTALNATANATGGRVQSSAVGFDRVSVVHPGADARAHRIQRKGDKVAKPGARILSDKSSLTKALEKVVDDDEHLSVVDTAALALYSCDADHYVNLMLYKLDKHVANPAKYDKYLQSIPPAARWSTFERAWARRNAAAVEGIFETAWGADRARCRKFAFDEPDYFVEHCLLAGLRRTEGGKLLLAAMVQEQEFLGNLKTCSAQAYGALVAQVPVLRLIEGVQDEVAQQVTAGAEMDVDTLVRKVFDAFVQNKGMEVAYSGTKIDQNPVLLTGSTDADTKARDAQKVRYRLPDKLSTACHELLHLLTSVMKSYPGLDDVTIEGKDEPAAVLTVALSTLDGGLVPPTFTGNVFSSAGKLTGTIFFSGDRKKISKSHSWLEINGVAYDPVLGTIGADVVAAIDGRFEFLDDEDHATEIGGNRKLVRERVLRNSGEHGLTTCWRFE